ncbi:MAG: electron transfer flavoprotein subunit alpha/FixB family protein [Dehalococcoidales bacterium]|nr:electron transfer flavoprotein subunit alpha/FixB family protein [Dehalococcoidales bacterium]
MTKQVWVIGAPYEDGGRRGTVFLPALFSEARRIAEACGGGLTAVSFAPDEVAIPGLPSVCGIERHYVLVSHGFSHFSAQAGATGLLALVQQEKPWLILMADVLPMRELAPFLAGSLKTGAITGVVNVDISEPERPRFFRKVYGGQLYEELSFRGENTAIVTFDPDFLPARATSAPSREPETIVRRIELPEGGLPEYLGSFSVPARDLDVTEARVVIGAGMGAIGDDVYPMVLELAGLLEGTIGTTRPVVDIGKIPRERMVGQTGKVIAPELYLALGVSGATHHVGGIQEAGRVIAVNRDAYAPIFKNADYGVAADLRDILPELIKRIRRAKENGEII